MPRDVKKWKATMWARYGGPEGLKEHMRSLSTKSNRNKGKPESAGFAKMSREDPERFKAVAAEGGRATSTKR